MTCPNCGAEVAEDQKLCNKCGFNLESAQNQNSGNEQGSSQASNIQNNGGSTGSIDSQNGNQFNQMNMNQNNNSVPNNGNAGQGAGFYQNNDQNAGFNPNNSQNTGFQPNASNNNQNFGTNGFQPNNQQNPGFQPNGQQFNGQQNFNNQSQFQNNQGNYQTQPSAVSYMMPFLKSNSALAICAAIIIVLIALFTWKVAAIVLVVALIAWYFLADKNHAQALPLNNSISSTFSNIGGNSVAADTAETNKMKLIVGIAAIVSLLFLFVGNFIGLTVDVTNIPDKDAQTFFQAVGISGSTFTFNGAITFLKKIVTFVITAGSYTSSLSTDDSTLEGAKAIKAFLSATRWIVILLPIITIIFTFVKNKASSIIRIIASALSTILLAALGIGIMTLHNNDDQDVKMMSQFLELGYSYYITIIASVVALVFAIRWLIINSRQNAEIRAQQMGNMNMQNMQSNNFGNPNQTNFNGNQNVPNNSANFNNGESAGNNSGNQNRNPGSGQQ
ncbi:zinc-ribbon domain-containing protein [Companilactobacillus furfuricola]|uniref:zinc-ribbon domain-containing protein n=1 Tax=Companilactobacillus furfuricola TaxID=1462575 RepID=UPI000F78BD11|nr:zinc-ribbon domain-containing protein [Companilactobacillus furfuricola]